MSAPLQDDVFLDLDAIETSEDAALTFKLGGKEWHCKNGDDVSWPLVESFFLAQSSGDAGAVMLHFDDLFAAVLYEDEVDDFFKMKEDKAGPMTYRRFSELAQKIVTAVFGVPTEPPGASRAGRRASAPISAASSSSRAKPSRRAG